MGGKNGNHHLIHDDIITQLYKLQMIFHGVMICNVSFIAHPQVVGGHRIQTCQKFLVWAAVTKVFMSFTRLHSLKNYG